MVEIGCKVVKAGRIVKGLQLIDTHHFDGAFLDVDVSGASILPIAESLKARHIPFAFVTGSDKEQIPAGFQDRPILSKPLAAPRFSEVVAHFAVTASAQTTPFVANAEQN